MRKSEKKISNSALILIIIIIVVIGGGIIVYNNKDVIKNESKKVNNEIDEIKQKKNYEFNGKNFVCDNFFSIDNEAIYISDGDIYYVIYKDGNFSQDKIVSKGKEVGIVSGRLVGYVDKNSIIDDNYAKRVEGTDYVIYSVKESSSNNKDDSGNSNVTDSNGNNNDNSKTDSSEVFNLDDINSENFYRGSGYSGASNKAVYLKNGVAYYLVFNGDNLVSREVIARNVKKIGNIGDNRSKIIVVFIDDDTVLDDKYKDYEIMYDDNGNKCIKIC